MLSPARRGAEPGSGEGTLSVRVVRALGRAQVETAEHQGRWAGGLSWVATRHPGARRRVPVPPAGPAGLPERVLLPFLAEGSGGWEAGSAQASPCPDAGLSVCGIGRRLRPLRICGRRGWLPGWGGVGLRPDRPGSAALTWVFLSDSVHFSPARPARAGVGPGGGPRRVEPVLWNGPVRAAIHWMLAPSQLRESSRSTSSPGRFARKYIRRGIKGALKIRVFFPSKKKKKGHLLVSQPAFCHRGRSCRNELLKGTQILVGKISR